MHEETIQMPARTEPKIVQQVVTRNKCRQYSEVRNQTIHDQKYEAITEQRTGTVNVTIGKRNALKNMTDSLQILVVQFHEIFVC